MKRPAAWIDTVPEEQAEGRLAELYRAERDRTTGRVDNILKVHSLHPETLADHARLYHRILHEAGEVSVPSREMIGLVVSNLNGCGY